MECILIDGLWIIKIQINLSDAVLAAFINKVRGLRQAS